MAQLEGILLAVQITIQTVAGNPFTSIYYLLLT